MFDNINVNFSKPKKPQQQTFEISTPFDNRFGFWGTVTAVHPEECTVNVRMDTGRELEGLRVASFEWVYKNDDKDFLSGERHLPPVDSFVFCLMPNGSPSSSFVLCSGFAKQAAIHDYYKDKEKEKENERIELSGWRKTTNIENGTKTIWNKPQEDKKTITVVIDHENEGDEKINIVVHGHEITVEKEFIEIKTDEKKVLIDTGKDTFCLDGDIDLMVKEKELLKIGNSIGTLGSLFDELCEALLAFYTNSAFAPMTHKHKAKMWAYEFIKPLQEKAARILRK